MALWSGKVRAFPNLEKAWKNFPRGYAGLRVLVFNKQGQPVLQYSNTGASAEVDERECAMGMELTRSIFLSVNAFSGGEPERVAFFFPNEVITVERSDPFIILVFWPPDTAQMEEEITRYLARLSMTLQEEFT